MRFGGHETFHIRDGWLHKGLRLLEKDPGAFASAKAADLLGVGENMAKSIRHWMVATGLAEKTATDSGVKSDSLYSLSLLGGIIAYYDPYLTDQNTWWALHINLVNNPDHAMSWHWFFNRFGHRRFEKGVCVENLKRFLQNQVSQRPPVDRTLERDVSVLLHTYARSIPELTTDPEDSRDCPLQELGLLQHFRETGFFRLNFEEKPIPADLLGYALTRPLNCEVGANVQLSTSALDAANGSCSPGRAFCMRPEGIFDLALRAEQELPDGWIRVTGLAGSRQISFRAWSAEDWLEHYYLCEAEKESLWLEEQEGELLKP